MPRVLVTGGRGMLGSDLCQLWKEHGHEVRQTDIDDLDVRRPEQLRAEFAAFRPGIVLHLAALTDVDGCEREPDEAWRTNALGTQHVAEACHEVGARLIYISTASVFDGGPDAPFNEFSTPHPLSVYSRSKLAGEEICRRILPGAYIFRAGWMFGGGNRDAKFVGKIVDLARNRDALDVVDDKFGTPTYTADLATGILRVLDAGPAGIYHLGNEGWASRFEIATAALEEAGITHCRLNPVSSAHFPLPAPRPRMEVLDNLMLRILGLPPQPGWRDALRRYLKSGNS